MNSKKKKNARLMVVLQAKIYLSDTVKRKNNVLKLATLSYTWICVTNYILELNNSMLGEMRWIKEIFFFFFHSETFLLLITHHLIKSNYAMDSLSFFFFAETVWNQRSSPFFFIIRCFLFHSTYAFITYFFYSLQLSQL